MSLAIIHKTRRSASLRSVGSLLIGMLLAACASSPEQPAVTAVDLSQPLDQPASFYLRQAVNSEPPASDQWRLLASQRYLAERQLNPAESLCQQLQGRFGDVKTQAVWAQHCATVAWKQLKGSKALERLATVSDDRYSQTQRQVVYRLRADIYAAQDMPLEAAEALSLLSDQLNVRQKLALHDEIWLQVMQLSDEQLAPFLENVAKDTLSQWLQLAAITRANAQNPTQLAELVKAWQNDNAGHPASRRLPANLQQALVIKPYKVQQIAVLLPLSGRFQAQGLAVRDGVLRAHFADSGENRPVLRFYDSAKDPQAAYQQALSNGAGFIIGPLTKPAISEILGEQDSTVPWLALNQLDMPLPAADDRFFFALKPESEVEQAVSQMWQAGIRHPLVIVPESGLGNRMLASFSGAWLEKGGEIAGSVQYANRQELPGTIGKLMGTGDSRARIQQLKDLLGVDLKSEARNRQDVDAIYIWAPDQDARLIRPYIDANLSTFSDYPLLLASARSYQPGQRNEDLNQVYIADIPLLLSQEPEQATARNELEQLWPLRNASTQRLYAMGHDAYTLHSQLRVMQLFSGYAIDGLSGKMTVNPRGEIERELSWGRIRRGYLRQVEGISQQ